MVTKILIVAGLIASVFLIMEVRRYVRSFQVKGPEPVKEPPPGFDSLEEWNEFKRRYKESHGYPVEEEER